MSKPHLPPSDGAMRRLKRSRTLHVGGLMATVSFSMAACGTQSEPPPLDAGARPTLAYTSLAECKASDHLPDDQCDVSWDDAQKQGLADGPRYATREACETAFGPAQCQSGTAGGASFFTPLVAGFVIGRLLDGGRYYGGSPLYRECTYRNRDGTCESRYGNGFGSGYIHRDYTTGRWLTDGNQHGDMARRAPNRVQSRTTVVSRGGFGGGGRGFGG